MRVDDVDEMIEAIPHRHGTDPVSFPRRETFVDCRGESREFQIALVPAPGGYFLRATELHRGPEGYRFAAQHPTAAHLALGRLRDKIRRGIAIRYLVTENGREHPGHDRLAGTIGFGGVIVDGRFLSVEALWEMIQTYEGMHFSLRLADLFDAHE